MCPHVLWITVVLQVIKSGTDLALIAVALWPNTLHSITCARLWFCVCHITGASVKVCCTQHSGYSFGLLVGTYSLSVALAFKLVLNETRIKWIIMCDLLQALRQAPPRQ